MRTPARGTRASVRNAESVARSAPLDTLPLPASSDPCPAPCLPLHVLEVGRFGPVSEEEWMRRERTMPPEAFDAWHEAHQGTRCTLCGQFVHWDTWHPYYLKWLREHGLPEPGADS